MHAIVKSAAAARRVQSLAASTCHPPLERWPVRRQAVPAEFAEHAIRLPHMRDYRNVSCFLPRCALG